MRITALSPSPQALQRTCQVLPSGGLIHPPEVVGAVEGLSCQEAGQDRGPAQNESAELISAPDVVESARHVT